MNRPNLITRLAGIMLVMSFACAVSGMLLDYRVMGLLRQAHEGTILGQQLDRADEVATVLLAFTLLVNLGAAISFGAWLFRSRRRMNALALVVAILLLNPLAPFIARGLDVGLVIAFSAKALAVACAVFAIERLRTHRAIPVSS